MTDPLVSSFDQLLITLYYSQITKHPIPLISYCCQGCQNGPNSPQSFTPNCKRVYSPVLILKVQGHITVNKPVISIIYIVAHTWQLCSAQILVDGVNPLESYFQKSTNISAIVQHMSVSFVSLQSTRVHLLIEHLHFEKNSCKSLWYGLSKILQNRHF